MIDWLNWLIWIAKDYKI
ncbi:hypothetical protein Godav_012919, partial [Gossypium davidsonii]|nr:hypothetical protein [Gossypium davidsonii]